MPWLKSGDNAATHPIVMRVAAIARRTPEIDPDSAVNEVFGFVMRCTLQSAGHTTDYVIDEGTAWMIGGKKTDSLLDLAKRAGYITRIRDSGLPAWRLIDDPEFLHMRLRAEIEWEQQQRSDSSNPSLTVPVRLRDGDACRYCRVIVNFSAGARKGNRAGTYDHREPGTAATPATLVVACKACNSSRRDDPDADDRKPLQPAPANPFYSSATATFLANHGHVVHTTTDLRPGDFLDAELKRSPDTLASSGPTSVGTDQQPVGDRDGTDQQPVGDRHSVARTRSGSADSADRMTTGSGLSGSGRDGTGSKSLPDQTVTKARPRRGRPRTGGSV